MNKNRGFTLIELLVAMGLFLIVLTIASGVFIRSLRLERASIELIAINNNASLTLEQMAREIRTGTAFSRPEIDTLQFTNYLGQTVVYRLNPVSGSIEKNVSGSGFEPLTASNVRIARLIFAVSGVNHGDKLQSRVTISLEVSGKSPLLRDVSTRVQTTISPRILDNS